MKKFALAFAMHPVTRYIFAIPLGILAIFAAMAISHFIVIYFIRSGQDEGKVFWFIPVNAAIDWGTNIFQGIAGPHYAITIAANVAPTQKVSFGAVIATLIFGLMAWLAYMLISMWSKIDLSEQIKLTTTNLVTLIFGFLMICSIATNDL